MTALRLLAVCVSFWVAAQASAAEPPVDNADAAASTNLPRFVSFRSDEVNLRAGPGTRYPITWVYRKDGLPVEVTEEFEHWRRVRLPDGENGWVFKGMLSGKRTVQVTEAVETVYLRPELNAPKLLRLERGVIAELKTCNDSWCHITIAGTDGWIRKKSLFGVYDGKTAY